MMAMKMIAVETSGVMQHRMIFNLLAGAQEITPYLSLQQVGDERSLLFIGGPLDSSLVIRVLPGI